MPLMLAQLILFKLNHPFLLKENYKLPSFINHQIELGTWMLQQEHIIMLPLPLPTVKSPMILVILKDGLMSN